MILDFVIKFERFVYAALMVLLMVVVVFSLIELCWLLVRSLTNPPPLLFENHELTNVLGAFLLILIGIELLDTIKAYFKEDAIHFEIVILLAIVAIARKVILLDPTAAPSAASFGLELIGFGVLVIGLAGTYYLIKRAGGIVVGEKDEKKTLL